MKNWTGNTSACPLAMRKKKLAPGNLSRDKTSTHSWSPRDRRNSYGWPGKVKLVYTPWQHFVGLIYLIILKLKERAQPVLWQTLDPYMNF
jgi:hypothetical protein